MEEILDLEIRRKLYQLIKENPGLHARKIAELLQIQGQLADYHLLYMERHGLLTASKEEGYTRYYITGSIDTKTRKHLSLLRLEIPLRIVVYLLKKPHTTHREILTNFDMAKSTLTYHLKKLVKHGIIIEQPEGTEKRYRIANENEIIQLIIQYKPYSRIESMKETWVDLEWPGAKKKKKK